MTWCEALRNLKPLEGHTAIRTLKLVGCHQLSPELQSLKSCPAMEAVDLAGLEWVNAIDLSTPSGAPCWPHLRSLRLNGCNRVNSFAPLGAGAGPTGAASLLFHLDLSFCRALTNTNFLAVRDS